MTIATAYLPAERAPEQELRRQHGCFAAESLLAVAFRAVPEPFMIVNRWRQVVYANPALENLAGHCTEGVLGRRPGEALGCTRAATAPGGCGTSRACTACGAVAAVRAALEGTPAVREAHLTTTAGDALDLKVTAHPLAAGSQHYALVAISDISAEKRRRALERIFFHDVLNTAGAVRSVAQLLCTQTALAGGELLPLLDESSARLVDEIEAQRLLAAAEANDLVSRPQLVRASDLLEEAARLMRAHEAALGKTVAVAPETAEMEFDTDPLILGRVLVNLVKNALEASDPAQVVTLGARRGPGTAEMWVHNPAVMSPLVQLQVFSRSFSTKGADRGLGTYGSRLLTERYLGGRIRFESAEGAGTTFTVSCPLSLPAEPAG
jgi:signal transduction histidine kinase